MEIPLKGKGTLSVLALILVLSAIYQMLSEGFFYGEMIRQIDETLLSQTTQILEGYEAYDRYLELIQAETQSDALALNRVHGEFLLKAMEQFYRQTLQGELDANQMQRRISSIIQHSENNVSLKTEIIWNASTHRNDLERLIRAAVQVPGETVSYPGDTPLALFQCKAVDIILGNEAVKPWKAYARAIYYDPLDLVVVFRDRSAGPEDNVERLYRMNRESLERTIGMTGTLEDVIILQKSGYTLYSGRFEAGSTRRITRMAFNDTDEPFGLSGILRNGEDGYKTLMIPTPGGNQEERYCYTVYDPAQEHHIILSRPTAAIEKKALLMTALSRFVAAVNLLLACIFAGMLHSWNEALEAEGRGQVRKAASRLRTSSAVLCLLFFLFGLHGLFSLQMFKHSLNSEILLRLQVETLRLAEGYSAIQEGKELALRRIIESNANRSRIMVEQVVGLVSVELAQGEPVPTPEEKAWLSALLTEHNRGEELFFWILDEQGELVLEPPEHATDVSLNYRRVLLESVKNGSEGTISLPSPQGMAGNVGYAKLIRPLGWTVFSFQPWRLLEREIQALEALERNNTDHLILHRSRGGSAGVVDRNLMIREYTNTQLEGHPVEDFRVKGFLTAPRLLFNKTEGYREYMILNPANGRSVFRQAYMHYDRSTGNTIFIAQNKQEVFQGVNGRSLPLLAVLAGISLMLFLFTAFGSVFPRRKGSLHAYPPGAFNDTIEGTKKSRRNL